MNHIKQILMKRDGLTEKEADDQIEQAKADMNERLANGELPYDICQEYFGLEPDYIFDLV